MKTLFKSIAICLVAVFVLGAFTACSPKPEDVAGTYVGTYVYNGNTFTKTITLGVAEYGEITYKNGEFSSEESGIYEIKGNKLLLYDSSSIVDRGAWSEYKYKNGVLENAGHKFVKV